MSRVQELINESNKKKSSKKTKNRDLYLKIIQAICEDDEYVSTYVKNVDSAGELITEDQHLSADFRKLIANALRRCTSMTMEEAEEAAKLYKVSLKDAETLHNIVMAGIGLTIVECDKKVQGIKRPDLDITFFTSDAPEAVRNNPRDDSLQTVIKPRKKFRAHQEIFAFQKTVQKRK